MNMVKKKKKKTSLVFQTKSRKQRKNQQHRCMNDAEINRDAKKNNTQNEEKHSSQWTYLECLIDPDFLLNSLALPKNWPKNLRSSTLAPSISTKTSSLLHNSLFSFFLKLSNFSLNPSSTSFTPFLDFRPFPVSFFSRKLLPPPLLQSSSSEASTTTMVRWSRPRLCVSCMKLHGNRSPTRPRYC